MRQRWSVKLMLIVDAQTVHSRNSYYGPVKLMADIVMLTTTVTYKLMTEVDEAKHHMCNDQAHG